MKFRFEPLVVAIFLIGSVCLFALFNASKPRILILHSQSKDALWVKNINDGLNRILGKRNDYTVSWYYMNTKNHPETEFKRNAGILATNMIESFKPDLIIACENDAQMYAADKYVNNPKINIIFAAIEGSAESYGYNQATNVTGIYTRNPLFSLKKLIAELRSIDGKPIGVRTVFIGDKSDAATLASKAIKAMDWSPLKLVGLKNVETFDEWKLAVAEASAKSDVIVLMNYHNILQVKGGNKLVEGTEVLKWTESHSKAPILGMGGYMVEDGGMLSLAPSGFEQGEVAARLAKTILDNGTHPEDIPQVMPHQYLIYIRQSLLDKRNIVIPNVYEAFARATNNYFSSDDEM